MGRPGQGNMLWPDVSFRALGHTAGQEERKWELTLGCKNEIALEEILRPMGQ